ncbi:MAG: 50S ribosomal protein L11 methyltransferase [Crocinitomicaceae bacterium]
MDTFAFHIELFPNQPWSEIAIAWLSEVGFDAFEETETGLIAYASETGIENPENSKAEIENWAKESDIQTNIEIVRIPQENWNARWESDFHPVSVEDRLIIVAPFHDKPKTGGLVVEIQPQMSFGTGHHQTTWMMSKALLDLDFLPEKVLDMGTGTGILAILAEKLGAKEIEAIDIEEWSAENTRENVIRNGCSTITTYHGDIELIEGKKFGLILANINKNVLKSHLSRYKDSLVPGGVLMLSGFFETDVKELMELARENGFQKQKEFNKETWAALQLQLMEE